MAEEATTTVDKSVQTDTTAAATTTEATQAAQTQATATETKAAETTQATETKPTETKTEEKPAEVKADPVDYSKVIGEVAMPEGYTLDPALAKTGGELFAKHGISAEAAKDLVAMYAQQQKAGADSSAKAFADQVGNWRSEAEKATTPEERGTAKEAALKVFGKDEVAVMEAFGLTNRAGFIKALSKVGKAIKDDSFVPGNAGVNGGRDARSYFPNTPNMNP